MNFDEEKKKIKEVNGNYYFDVVFSKGYRMPKKFCEKISTEAKKVFRIDTDNIDTGVRSIGLSARKDESYKALAHCIENKQLIKVV